MAVTTLPPVPPGCRRRLTAHYGQQVNIWLDSVPGLLATAAERWSLTLVGYYDAGHASVLATATDQDGLLLLVKVWADRDRYSHEIPALRLWHRGPDAVVRATDDDLAAAALLMVGGVPGGANRPRHEAGLVSAALQRAHEIGCGDPFLAGLPTLHDFIADEVLPRIHRRRAATGKPHLVERALPYTARTLENSARTTILHTDLYRENVLFTQEGRPVLLDPLPMAGDAAYDWAFWSVYYQLGHDTGHRLHQALRVSGIPAEAVLPWCVLLSLDGLLYYEETADLRVSGMTAVLNNLLALSTRCL
ncbi:phosphotransferase [Streptomyces sp. SCUT-3]|uniref:aminoglycoside phosphotransferase family protein n=1 Tax=Streptomyces sp. SCUT-3 TaxID=2684469 RepID=UPI000CA96984|nr:aminoglycoside phosphotransferase family protein [Streptomyces sp. SCUT-3]PLW65691.1 phosphotransferase [Streptomyces sp. DJ]QMV23495.1 phosphotransferase [Streptomyces sp. SCUT-3]